MLFVFEQPHTAKSWQDPSVTGVAKMPEVSQIIVDQCMFGLRDVQNRKLHGKRTKLLTNSTHVASRMSRLCDGGHSHQHVFFGSVKAEEGWKRSALAGIS